MKKVLLAVAVLAVMGLASCNKEKECTCTAKYTGTGIDMPDVVTTFKTKEKCNTGDVTTNMGGMTTTTTCKEK